uniref:S-phase kinase-associated protein 2, E3 ubiquitin protein ligase n=1 Tax=Cynoglossus semilaevis TaxID=244447 RepID=A0A3P8WSB4_CYNSE
HQSHRIFIRISLFLQGSMLTQSNKRKSRNFLSEGLDTECTPTELIQQCSPRHKLQRLNTKDKENDYGHFVLARRPRRKKESSTGISWDQLPDELLLKIFFYLPLQDLLGISRVCKRWHRLMFDESLWHSVDLEGMTQADAALRHVLKTKVTRLRCPRECVCLTPTPLQMAELDLSSSIIPTSVLESIICGCRQLRCLSLEGLQLSDLIIKSVAQNTHLLQLNLSGCSGFSDAALTDMLQSCSSLEQLNLSWCDLCFVGGVGFLSDRTVLNVALIHICPVSSDSTLLMADSFPVLAQLKHLQHLSLSRCYHIHVAALTDLGTTIPSLCLLDVFGLVPNGHLPVLKKDLPRICINSKPFSTIARPTPASTPAVPLSDRSMWGSRCRLRVRM